MCSGTSKVVCGRRMVRWLSPFEWRGPGQGLSLTLIPTNQTGQKEKGRQKKKQKKDPDPGPTVVLHPTPKAPTSQQACNPKPCATDLKPCLPASECVSRNPANPSPLIALFRPASKETEDCRDVDGAVYVRHHQDTGCPKL